MNEGRNNDAPRDLDLPRMGPLPEYPFMESMADILRRAGPPIGPESTPHSHSDAKESQGSHVVVAESQEDPLAELARLIAMPPRVPQIGVRASKDMAQCFETVANDIEMLAKDGVERANRVYQEAISYASVLRESGKFLCEKMEDEAARAYKISMVMREARKAFGEPEVPDGGQSPPPTGA